ncbi:MAG: MMPL family transporter [Clostridiaceae bacterium]|nr:MMPL family transporter [Clostridiaceae bacterium]
MRKLAEFIVDKRKFLLIIFIAAAIGSVIMSSHINVIQELTDYLPDDTETSIGLDVMDEQFTTFGTAKVMVQNVTYDQAKAIADQLKDIKGVSAVDFYEEDEEDENNDTEEKEFTNSEDMRDSYQDLAALYSISFETPEDDSLAQAAIADVRTALKDYDAWFYTTVDKDDAADLQDDMKVILVIAVIIIVGVLLFTSGTYMEIAIFMLVFGMAALLNMGTNFIFYNISFVTNAVATVLQLAMAIDYAIILFHRFMEEKGKVNTREALVRALEKGIPEISSSSLTTMAGMVALMFMQFGIGLDLGRVMIKAILLSMLSVFGFMPGLIMLWEKQIDRTLHKSFVPNIEFWGKIVLAIRHVTLPIFAIVMVVACFLSVNCNYIYDNSSVESAKMNEYMTAKREISKVFDLDNTLAVVVPKGDYDSEARIMEEVESLPMVDSTLGLANVTVDDDEQYVLTDSLTPQELADITDMDIDTIRLLYRFYAWKEEKYGAFLNSIDDFEIPLLSMIDFIYGEEENETFDFSADFSQDIQDMHKTVSDAREQLEGDEYSRMLVMTTGPIEGDEIFHTIDQIRDIAYQYYHEVYVVGDSTSDYDLSKSFTQDNLMVSIMTAVFVAIILLFTFTNYSIPLILVATIQTSIWINFSIPAVTGTGMFFLSYLIVSSIQMGATIDYAIVITSRYTAYRKENVDKRTAIIKTLNESFPTIITSGTIMTSAGFVIGQITSNPVIASLGTTLGTGTLTSIILVMLILPQLLYAFDGVINKTYRKRRINIGGGETQTNGGAE